MVHHAAVIALTTAAGWGVVVGGCVDLRRAATSPVGVGVVASPASATSVSAEHGTVVQTSIGGADGRSYLSDVGAVVGVGGAVVSLLVLVMVIRHHVKGDTSVHRARGGGNTSPLRPLNPS